MSCRVDIFALPRVTCSQNSGSPMQPGSSNYSWHEILIDGIGVGRRQRARQLGRFRSSESALVWYAARKIQVTLEKERAHWIGTHTLPLFPAPLLLFGLQTAVQLFRSRDEGAFVSMQRRCSINYIDQWSFMPIQPLGRLVAPEIAHEG